MRLFGKLVSITLFGAAITVACGQPGGAGEGDLGTRTDAVCNGFCPPPGDDDDDTCTPSCAGKACGALDGCGGKCLNGACPAGTTCGGGGLSGQCGCTPSCAGKACGAPDGCGGICYGGECPAGQACGAGGVPAQCATLPVGQGVECFVFNDGYTDMAGPSHAVYLASTGQACIPDGTAAGTCRKWFGRCRTTDPSHTPVLYRVFDGNGANASAPADAVFSPERDKACVPGNGATGVCRRWFGDMTLTDGRPVECRLFDDGGTQKTKFTEDEFYNFGSSKVCLPDGSPYGLCRKWFGECMVAGCGDGACNNGETPSSCPSDCKCGDGLCNGAESCGTCPGDCGSCCGNGTCNANECNTCPQDCTGKCCGDGACNAGESCNSCSGDCGACAPTEHGQLFQLSALHPPGGGQRVFAGTFGGLLTDATRLKSIQNKSSYLLAFRKGSATLNCSDPATYVEVSVNQIVTPGDLGYTDDLPVDLVACSTAPLNLENVAINIRYLVP
ncbi:MAG TPA: hypothetical protein VFS00_20670 [Polyangiaceae bacterium]|nr:hypothetical protein [Polyangiaceae bacterium]